MTKRLLVFSFLLFALPLSAADAVRAQRLFDLGRVWSAIKWFHPYLAYRNDIDWDAAGMRAIARASAAKDGEQYAAAVEEMLSALGDDSTRVIRDARRPPPAADPARERHPATTLRQDDVLVARIRYYEDFSDFAGAGQRIDAMVKLFPSAKAIVFDLRPLDVEGNDGRALFTFRWLGTQLTKEELLMPSIRSRMHEGFVAESGSGGSGGYASSFVTTDAVRTTPAKEAVSVPVIFLINERADFPPVAIALQQAGRGAVVVHGAASDAGMVPTARFDLADGVEVAVRTGEVVNPDGTIGFTPRLLLPRETSDAEALNKAIELAKNFTPAPAPSRTTAVPASPRKPPTYEGNPYPSAEARVLAGWKIWSVFEHFFPYRDLIGEDWNAVVREFLPRLHAAKDTAEYHLTISELLTHVHDSHVAANSDTLGELLGGQAVPPVMVRVIEDQMVVTGFYDEPAARAAGLDVGDVITAVNGEDVKAGLARMARYVPASTPQSLARVGAVRLISSTKDGEVTLKVGGRSVTVPRKRTFWNPRRHSDRPGEVVRILPGDIGYVDLARLEGKDVDAMFDQLRETKAIVFDNRGYPRGTVWAIAPRLTEKERFAAALIDRPMATLRGSGALDQTIVNRVLQHPPRRTKWAYTKPTYMLIDERAMSQSEHTALFFRAANGTKFIGSPTAGANGDVTSFFVPGGIRISFSGQSVRWPDGRQLQRVGVQPDVLVRPTIAGIRARKDEVLEKALELVNAEVTAATPK